MKSKKDLIFEAVIDHIKRKGLLTGLTISEIAKKADVGKGTVYEYFNSKDELIAETFIYILDDSIGRIVKVNNFKLNFQETLFSHIKLLMELSKEYTNIDKLIITGDLGQLLKSNIRQKMINKMFELKYKYHDYLNDIFEKGIKEGIISQVNDQYITFIITRIIMASVSYYNHITDDDKNDGDFINKVYNLIIKILK